MDIPIHLKEDIEDKNKEIMGIQYVCLIFFTLYTLNIVTYAQKIYPKFSDIAY